MRKLDYFLLVFLFLLSFLMRAYFAPVHTLGPEEVLIAGIAKGIYLTGSVNSDFFGEKLISGTPIFPAILSFFYLFTGPSDVVARLVVAFFASLTIPVIYLIVRRDFPFEAALAASLFLSFAPEYWVTGMRLFLDIPMLFFLSVCCFFLLAYYEEGGTRDLLLSSLFFALAFLIKVSAVFLLPLFVFVLFSRKPGFSAAPALALVALSFAVYTAYNPMFLGSARIRIFHEFLPVYFYLLRPQVASVPIFALAFIGVLSSLRRRSDCFFLAWFFSVFVLSSLLPNKHDRYSAVFLQPMAVFASIALSRFVRSRQYLYISLLFVLVAAGLVSFSLIGKLNSSYECIDDLARELGPEAGLVYTACPRQVLYYSSPGFGGTVSEFPSETEFSQALSDGGLGYVIYSPCCSPDPHPAYLAGYLENSSLFEPFVDYGERAKIYRSLLYKGV